MHLKESFRGLFHISTLPTDTHFVIAISFFAFSMYYIVSPLLPFSVLSHSPNPSAQPTPNFYTAGIAKKKKQEDVRV